MRGILLLSILVLSAWVPPPAAGGGRVFAWQGPDGVTHFADHPGVPGAPTVRPGHGQLSFVETVPVHDNAMRPVIEKEIRRQQRNRERARRETLADMDRHEKQCQRYRNDLAKAEHARQRARVRELEDQWFARCR